MKSKINWKKFLQYIIILVIFIFIGKYLYNSWNEISNYSWEINILLLILSYFFLFLFFIITPIGWRLILKHLKEKLNYKKTIKYWFLSQLGKYIPGKIWFVLGRIYYCKKEGISIKNSFASMTLETALNAFASLIIFLLSLLFWTEGKEQFLPLVILVPIALIFLHPKIFIGLLNFGLKIIKKKPININIRYKDILFLTSLFCVFWIIQGFAFSLFVSVIYPIEISLYPILIGIFAVAWILGFISIFTPGGLGVREGVIAFLLSFYISPGIAIVIALAARLWVTLGEIIMIGLVSLIKTNHTLSHRLK